MHETTEKILGKFEVSSNKIHISDPCYEYDEQDTTCVLTLKEVLNGKYFAKINVIGRYNDVESLTICHEKYPEVEPDFLTGTIGVDSGQAGIFDLKYYAENQGGEYEVYVGENDIGEIVSVSIIFINYD